MAQRIVLAFGGADASGPIEWLARTHDAQVVTLTLDLGDGMAVDTQRVRALAAGAIRAHVLDVHEEFARDIMLPAAQTGAVAGAASVSALARPLLARKLIEIARIEKADAVASLAGLSAVPLQALVHATDPDLPVVVVPGGVDAGRPRTPRHPGARPPDRPAHVEIAFDQRVPIMINGIAMRLPELLESLATIAAEHGLGAGDDFYRPALTVLQAAYTRLVDADGTVHLKLFEGRCHAGEGATAHV